MGFWEFLMAKYLRILFVFSFVVFPVFSAHAKDEEKAQSAAVCKSCTKCGEVEKGSAGMPEGGYCDIYARQLAYREEAKSFRESLEKRAVAYEAPRIEAVEAYRANREALYKEESKKYQEELARQAAEAEASMSSGMGEQAGAMDESEETDTASAAEPTAEEGMPEVPSETEISEEGLKEKVVQDSDTETKVKKVIIMPEDAPDF